MGQRSRGLRGKPKFKLGDVAGNKEASRRFSPGDERRTLNLAAHNYAVQSDINGTASAMLKSTRTRPACIANMNIESD